MSLFGGAEQREDVNKDANGQGTFERYNNIIAEDLDDYISPLISGLQTNVIDPTTALEQYLDYLEGNNGGSPIYTTDTAIRRKVLRNIQKYADWKGTKRNYIQLFKILGFGTTLTEHFDYFTFDSSTTLDDDTRRFDMGICQQRCTDYSLALTGSVTITPEYVTGIFRVIQYNEPINAKLRGITYNGDPLVYLVISVTVDANGDLVYNNDYDPSLILELIDGDLVASGPMAQYYSIVGGDLIFQI